MKNKLCYLLLATAALVALSAAGYGYRSDSALAATRARVVQGLLEPAAALLEQNQALLKELQAGQAAEPGHEVLVAYLAKIRRDGVPAHGASRKRLDQIADNQVAIVTLLTAYAPHARTPALQAAADQYSAHANSWRTRWGSVMEVFMAGGTFATAELPFPTHLADRLRDELASTR
jgi:hypothetical protein